MASQAMDASDVQTIEKRVDQMCERALQLLTQLPDIASTPRSTPRGERDGHGSSRNPLHVEICDGGRAYLAV